MRHYQFLSNLGVNLSLVLPLDLDPKDFFNDPNSPLMEAEEGRLSMLLEEGSRGLEKKKKSMTHKTKLNIEQLFLDDFIVVATRLIYTNCICNKWKDYIMYAIVIIIIIEVNIIKLGILSLTMLIFITKPNIENLN